MALSGSYDYTVTASDVINKALTDIQVLSNGETVDNNDLATALVSLNLMTKEWMGKPGYAPGLKRWTRKTAYLFLRLNKNIYALGTAANSGDKCCVAEYTQGTLTAAAAGGASTVAVSLMYASPTYTTTTAPSATDYIGVQLDSGDFHWTVAPAGAISLPGNIGLTVVLPSAASAGNYVYSFTTANQTNLPLDVLTCMRRDPTASQAIDFQMDKMGDIYEYEQIPNKNITSTPVSWWYQQGLSVGSLYINCVPAQITNVLRMTLLYPIDDLDIVSNTMAFPQQWYGALRWALAKDLAPGFGKSWTQTMEDNLSAAMASAANVDPDMTYQYFQPGRE